MTTAPDSLDLRARQLHASALAHTSPATLARLRQARQAAHQAAQNSTRSRWRTPWLTGGALAAALALAVVLRPEAPIPNLPETLAVVAEADQSATALQEDPGFYLWLASADAPALALE